LPKLPEKDSIDVLDRMTFRRNAPFLVNDKKAIIYHHHPITSPVQGDENQYNAIVIPFGNNSLK
jgi:hypothetical protein